MILGKGDPEVPQTFFEFDLVRLSDVRGNDPRKGSILLRVVSNKRDFPNFKWLTGAIVKINETGTDRFYKVKEVVLFEKFEHPSKNRVGELIGILGAEING